MNRRKFLGLLAGLPLLAALPSLPREDSELYLKDGSDWYLPEESDAITFVVDDFTPSAVPLPKNLIDSQGRVWVLYKVDSREIGKYGEGI